jgi:hypothetical protein
MARFVPSATLALRPAVPRGHDRIGEAIRQRE